MKNNLFVLIFTIIILIIGFSSASKENYPAQDLNKQFTFCQTCADATYVTLSSILTPNQTINVNSNMTKIGYDFCYNYTPLLNGVHDFRGASDGCQKTFAVHVPVGKDPEGIVIIIFVFTFLVILGFLAYLMMNVVQYFIELKAQRKQGMYKEQLSIFGIKPLMLNVSAYLVLLGYYSLEIYYLANPIIDNFMPRIIFITSITNVVFPVLAFVISLGFAGWNAVTQSISGGRRYG